MKKLILIFVPFLFIACSSSELVNMDIAKKRVQNYYENGQYESEMKEIIDNTIKELKQSDWGKNPLVILDIDETTLSNYEHTKNLGFGFNWELWQEWLRQADADAIPQTKRLYNWLTNNDVKIVFITGRQPDVYESTLKNLKNEGFTEFEQLITRSERTSKMSAVIFKSYERGILADKGYTILATVGDQWSDLEGENTGLKVKLPNYLYLID